MNDEELRLEQRRTELGEPSRRRLVELTRLASALEETWLEAAVYVPNPHALDCGRLRAPGGVVECTCNSRLGEDKASTDDIFYSNLVERASVESVLSARRTLVGRMLFDFCSAQLQLLDVVRS